MIRNDHELAVMRERVGSLEKVLEALRKTARPQEWPALSSGYRLEIERMQGEILDYRRSGKAAEHSAGEHRRPAPGWSLPYAAAGSSRRARAAARRCRADHRDGGGRCGSTGWIQGIYSDHCATLGMFDAQAQKDVWGTAPDSLISSGFQPVGKAVRVDGGYRLAGRWPFSSGCDHADWALVRSFVPAAVETEPPELYMFLVPKTDYTIIDNWFVMGMSATGSKDFELKGEVFVPGHRALMLRDVHAAGQHMALNWDVAGSTYGRVMAGLPPGQDL